MTEHAMEQLMRQDIDATLMWLRHGGVSTPARIDMGKKLMMGSVAAQAVVAGVLDCGYCWDQGCSVCDLSGASLWQANMARARVMFGTGWAEAL